jgi:membrane protein
MARRVLSRARGTYSLMSKEKSEDRRRPTPPHRLSLRGWWRVLRRTWTRFGDDHVTLLAGGVAFAWFLALFPGLIAAVMIYGLVTDPADVENQISKVAEGLPAEAQTLLTNQMNDIANSSSQGLSIGLAVSLALALWSTSAGIAGLVEAVNVAYDEVETRNFVVKRGLAIVLTLGFIVFLALAIGLIAVLPIVLGQLSVGVVAMSIVDVVRWAGLVVLAIIGLGVIYRIGPDRDVPKVRWLSVGAMTAAALWILASVAMAVFVDNFGRYGETYGSLAGVVVLMLWLWITAIAALLGAEVNAEVETQTSRKSGTDSEGSADVRETVGADAGATAPRSHASAS